MGVKRDLLEMAVATMRLASRVRKPNRPYKIFVLRNNNLGDLVVVTPLFEALRQTFPDSLIVAGVCSWSKEILQNNPYLSEVLDCNAPWHNHRAPRKSLISAAKYIFSSPEVALLRSYEFDIGIDVLGSPFGSMLMMHLNIPIRLGRKGYAGGHSGATAVLEYSPEVSVTRDALRFVPLLKADATIDFDTTPQLFLTPAEVEEAREAWREIERSSSAGPLRIVIAPGAGAQDKQWPIERFAQLARVLSKYASGCILGSRDDVPAGDLIVSAAEDWSNQCGKVSIRQSMALISEADLVICHSSFVMHLAAAFKKPTVVILTRAFDRQAHTRLWEIEGLHHQVYPSGGDEQVSVPSVEAQTIALLNQIESSKRHIVS